MSISYVQNGDSGLTARTIINQAIDGVNTGTFPYTGSAKITGSLSITGSATSTGGFTGSVFGTASFATTSSYAVFAVTSLNTSNAFSSSYARSASYALNSSLATTSSYTVSSSYAITASYALNGGGGGSTDTGSLLMTASVVSNTITFTKGNGTTFPITVAGGSGSATFPYTGSAIISGSLRITGSLTLQNANIGNGGLVYYSTSSGVINQTDFLFDGAGKITGGTRTTLDLSTAGTISGAGLVLPTSQPISPIEGSIYADIRGKNLYIWDGGIWLSSSLG